MLSIIAEKKSRIEICNACPKKSSDARGEICTMCNCTIEALTSILQKPCPLKKWDETLFEFSKCEVRKFNNLSFKVSYDGVDYEKCNLILVTLGDKIVNTTLTLVKNDKVISIIKKPEISVEEFLKLLLEENNFIKQIFNL